MAEPQWQPVPSFTPKQVLTASEMTIIGGNLGFLSGAIGNVVATFDSTSSSTYVATLVNGSSGPTVSLTTGANAIVILTCFGESSIANGGFSMAYAVSGATSAPATQARSIFGSGLSPDFGMTMSALFWHSGLNVGLNTFTAEYQSVTSSNVAGFSNRNIIVIPLP